jgi:hypothetical protein
MMPVSTYLPNLPGVAYFVALEIEIRALTATPCSRDAPVLGLLHIEPAGLSRDAGWVAKAARFPVPFARTGLRRADSVVEGHRLN